MKFYNWLNEKNTDYVVVYPGRFQPWHSGHFQTYQRIVSQFGNENVYIATSNKVDPPKSPFNFKEKYNIITKMFPIPKDKVIQIKNPYSPKEILSKYDENTIYITVVGKKDAQRLSNGKYFDIYDNTVDMKGYKEKGYVWIAPENTTYYDGKPLSGTRVREIFSNASEEEKKELFLSLYPKWDKKIFELITSKIK